MPANIDHSRPRGAGLISISPRRLLKRIRPNIRAEIANLVRATIVHRPSRATANFVYSSLPWSLKHFVQKEYRELFLHHDWDAPPAFWKVRFAGRTVRVPLRPELAALDWDLAVSALGHDVHVKQTYDALLRSPHPPRVFFDVGANYGQHSLLFLAHGARVISFEPNDACHRYFRDVAALNGLTPDIRPLVVSDAEGVTDFWFPEDRTWMGTADARVKDELEREGKLKQIRVQQTTIDSFVEKEGVAPDLVKIDAEGSEVRIINGARKTLATHRPAVIFESWPGAEREAQRDAFAAVSYEIASLPLRDARNPTALSSDAFSEHPALNFLAFSA